MDNLNSLKINLPISKLISLVCSSGIPAIVNLIVFKIFYNTENLDYILAVTTIMSFALSIIFTIIIYNLLPQIKFFRAYKKYEGKWLQIIPESVEKPYSIIDFVYKKDLQKYELHGINYFEDLSDGISFDAYRFVERTFKDGFYYITNQTSEYKNGLCKIGFIQSNYDNLTRAEGYFFDSSNEGCSKKYNTIIVKCDKSFYEHLGAQYKYMNINDIPPIEIIKLSKKFADEEIQKYKSHNKTTNICDLCYEKCNKVQEN